MVEFQFPLIGVETVLKWTMNSNSDCIWGLAQSLPIAPLWRLWWHFRSSAKGHWSWLCLRKSLKKDIRVFPYFCCPWLFSSHPQFCYISRLLDQRCYSLLNSFWAIFYTCSLANKISYLPYMFSANELCNDSSKHPWPRKSPVLVFIPFPGSTKRISSINTPCKCQLFLCILSSTFHLHWFLRGYRVSLSLSVTHTHTKSQW